MGCFSDAFPYCLLFFIRTCSYLYSKLHILVRIISNELCDSNHFVICLSPSLANCLVGKCDDWGTHFKGLSCCCVAAEICRVQNDIRNIVHSHQLWMRHSLHEYNTVQIHACILESMLHFWMQVAKFSLHLHQNYNSIWVSLLDLTEHLIKDKMIFKRRLRAEVPIGTCLFHHLFSTLIRKEIYGSFCVMAKGLTTKERNSILCSRDIVFPRFIPWEQYQFFCVKALRYLRVR
mmetsp:Transcript_3543/g.6691  ORF Transcript_3543/g.6691 Transcript_3543/m.6691 type:complete len:233 (+) Transcript_3543:401-1099(+)